jgi:D-alanine transaminase
MENTSLQEKPMPTVYLNGEYVPLEEAKVPVEDRGFLFSDGIYEVVRFYHGHPFQLEAHLKRLEHSAQGAHLPLGSVVTDLPSIIDHLITENNLRDTNVYIQYTRGVAHPRSHPFPLTTEPTLFVMPVAIHALPGDALTNGVSAITLPDLRWRRCDIKSTMLLPNVIAKQQAREAGAYEAILVRNGIVTEGSSTNIFAIIDGVLTTHPANGDILGGITRQVVLALADELRMNIREEGIKLNQLYDAEEVFLASTTSQIMPITQVDGAAIGDGHPGTRTMRLLEAFEKRVTS